VLGRGPENWHFSYLTAPAGQAPIEWAQAYFCGGAAAGLGLRGAETEDPTVAYVWHCIKLGGRGMGRGLKYAYTGWLIIKYPTRQYAISPQPVV